MLTVNNLSRLRCFPYLYEKTHTAFSTSSSTKLDFLMKKFIDSKQYQKALDLFEQQSKQRTNTTINMALKACSQLEDYQRGLNIIKQLSSQTLKNQFTQTALIHFYMQCHDMENANRIFSTITNKSHFTYTVMFKGLNLIYYLFDEQFFLPLGYISNNMSEKVFGLLDEMIIPPNEFTLSIIFKACAQVNNQRARKIGYQLLNQLPNAFRTDLILLNSAISMLMSFGDVERAEHFFGLIEKKSIVSYIVMMTGYVENNMSEKALDLFEQMSLNPNNAVHSVIFKVCAKLKNERAIHIGKKLLDQIFNKQITDLIVLTSAIDMLMSFGDVKKAEHLFESIHKKNSVCYGAMMKGYLANDMSERVLDLFEQISLNPNNIIHTIVFRACAQLADERAMKLGNKLLGQISNESEISNIVLTSALHMLMRFDNVKCAQLLFESIKNKDMSIYASMMKAYNLNRQPSKCLELFQQMKQQDIVPDETTFTLAINACSQLGILAVCESFVTQIPSYLYGEQCISNVLINMWGKAGSVTNAEKIFRTMKNPDIVTYNSMINGYGLNGRGAEAIDLFQQTPQHARDAVTYTVTLNACSHAGLLKQARVIFNQANIKSKRITTTMIDCLSRLYLFDEAQNILANFEKSSSPHLPMYMAIISGARNSRNSIVSESVYNRMKTLFPNQKNCLISGAILLANIYSSLGDDDQAAITRSNRKTNYGNKVKPGLTWTEKDGEIAEFGAHDQLHTLSIEIHDEAKEIRRELSQHGHRPDPSWLTRPLGDDETIESVMCGHSEQLAIAFHFIRGRRPSFIQLTKNLRICGECHQATKLIAKIRQCEIVLRDANRIHHFSKTGTCSCQDHF